MHRGGHVIGHVVGKLEAHLGVVFGQVHAVGPTNRNNLAHHLEQERAGLWIRADRANRLANCRCGPRQPYQEDILLPDLAKDVFGELCLDAPREAGLEKGLPRGDRDLSNSPNSSLCIGPVWRMTPGLSIVVAT
jgi:hypothetical protein